MRIVILERHKKIAESLKRCISTKFQCLIEENLDLQSLEKKYKGSETTFVIGECILEQNGINKEGLKLAHWIINKLNQKVLVFGLETKGITFIPYLKIPFYLENLFEVISKSSGTEKIIENNILLDKYEHFRSKISHDYLQYVTKNYNFYKFLLLNFYKYTNLIFGIDLNEEKIISSETFKESLERFETQKNSSLLYNLLRKLKLDDIEKIKLKEIPESKERFFRNIDFLTEILADKKEATSDLEEKVAENFLLSWYMWRKLFFLEKYNQHFSDGFYKGCFRILLSYNRPYYQEMKKDTLVNIFNSPDILESIDCIKLETKKLKKIL